MPLSNSGESARQRKSRASGKLHRGAGRGLELQTMRRLSLGATAAHLLGELQQDDSSLRVRNRSSITGCRIIAAWSALNAVSTRTCAGGPGGSLLVNSQGYRQSENVENQPEPGQNVVLTLDLDLQRAAEASLAEHQRRRRRAAVVVMDVRNGDVLAMASSPTIDPNISPAHCRRRKCAEAARRADVKCGRKSTAPRRKITRRAPSSRWSSAWPRSKRIESGKIHVEADPRSRARDASTSAGE